MSDLQSLQDADLLTLSGLLSALLDLTKSEAITLPRNLTLRALTAALVTELNRRQRLEDSANVHVIVYAADQLTEWSNGGKSSKNLTDKDLLS